MSLESENRARRSFVRSFSQWRGLTVKIRFTRCFLHKQVLLKTCSALGYISYSDFHSGIDVVMLPALTHRFRKRLKLP